MADATFSYLHFKCKSCCDLSSGEEQDETIVRIYPLSYEEVIGRMPYDDGDEPRRKNEAQYRYDKDLRSQMRRRDRDRIENVLGEVRHEMDISFPQLCVKLAEWKDTTTLQIYVGVERTEVLNGLLQEDWDCFCTTVSSSFPLLQSLELRSMEGRALLDRPEEVLNDEKLNKLLQAVPASLKYLHLTDLDDFPLSFQQIGRFRNLESLVLERSYWGNEGELVRGISWTTWNILAEVLPTLPCLKNVLLEGLMLVNLFLEVWTVLDGCARIQGLQNIQIYDCYLREEVIRGEFMSMSTKKASIPISIQSRLEYRPRLHSSGLFLLLPNSENVTMEEWTNVLINVCDRVDCIYAVLTAMDPDVFAGAALKVKNPSTTKTLKRQRCGVTKS